MKDAHYSLDSLSRLKASYYVDLEWLGFLGESWQTRMDMDCGSFLAGSFLRLFFPDS